MVVVMIASRFCRWLGLYFLSVFVVAVRSEVVASRLCLLYFFSVKFSAKFLYSCEVTKKKTAWGQE